MRSTAKHRSRLSGTAKQADRGAEWARRGPAPARGRRREVVYFLSDYGLLDEFTGVVKAQILRVAPGAQVVDLSHGVPPHDVRWGALSLARAAPFLGDAVVLAVVDPGVGTSRRAVGIQAAAGTTFVGPDNGLLMEAADAAGGATLAVQLHPARRRGPTGEAGPHAGPTFDGRDVFAPAAARLCLGAGLASLGNEIDPAGLVRLEPARCWREGDAIVAEVVWVDRFGNAQLAAGPEVLAHLGDRLSLAMPRRAARGTSGRGGTERTSEGAAAKLPAQHVGARRVSAFEELAPGEIGVILDSSGGLAIVMRERSAAAEVGLSAGTQVRLGPPLRR